MHRLIALVILLAAACQQEKAPEGRSAVNQFRLPAEEIGLRLPPPEAFVRAEDRARVQRLRNGGDAPLPCEDILGANERIDLCYRFGPPKRWRGLWRDNFEGSEFCEAPAIDCGDRPPETSTWLSFADPKMERRPASYGLFSVDFIGRRSVYPGIGYGHMGMSEHEIIVDRMISMKAIKAPAKD